MSATNRGGSRIEHDVYSTPSWCTRRILEVLPLSVMGWGNVLSREPCAGEGAISKILRAVGCEYVLESDIRPAQTGTVIADATITPDIRVHLCITNPPYTLAEEIIRAQLPMCDWGVFLVRQGFMSSAKRAGWLRGDMPDTYELPQRPSFAASLKCVGVPSEAVYGCGWGVIQSLDERRPIVCPQCNVGDVRVTTSDAADYCWLVWTPERGRSWGKRFILPDTSLEERKLG